MMIGILQMIVHNKQTETLTSWLWLLYPMLKGQACCIKMEAIVRLILACCFTLVWFCWFAGFLDKDDDLQTEFKTLSDQMRNSFTFAHTTSEDVMAEMGHREYVFFSPSFLLKLNSR